MSNNLQPLTFLFNKHSQQQQPQSPSEPKIQFPSQTNSPQTTSNVQPQQSPTEKHQTSLSSLPSIKPQLTNEKTDLEPSVSSGIQKLSPKRENEDGVANHTKKKKDNQYHFVQYQQQNYSPSNEQHQGIEKISPGEKNSVPHHHHHHVISRPHHHHKRQPSQPKFIKNPPPKLNIQPITDLLREFHPKRHFLGTLVYNPTTTWDTLQNSQLYGLSNKAQQQLNHIKHEFMIRKNQEHQNVFDDYLKIRYIPVIPPLTSEYINSIIEVKIPFRYIVEFKQDLNNEIYKRELWGGASSIYTDDSDLLEVLMHMGFFNDTIDLSVWNKKWTKKDLVFPLKVGGGEIKENKEKENVGKEIEEKSEDTQDIETGVLGDLAVEILLLPTLPKYFGYYANGINSRSWTHESVHNGLSMTVFNVKWETRDSYLNDRSLFKLYQKELDNALLIE